MSDLKALKEEYVKKLIVPIQPKFVAFGSIGAGLVFLVVAVVLFLLAKSKNKKVCHVATSDDLDKLREIKGLKTIKYFVSGRNEETPKPESKPKKVAKTPKKNKKEHEA